MSGSARRPDLIGAAFGAFLLLATFGVAAKVLLSDGDASGGTLGRVIPGFAREPAVEGQDHDEYFSLGGPGLGAPLPPLYYDGPRELVAPAPHEPDELSLPGLGVRTRLLRLDKRPDGRMQVPGDFALAGWYVRGPAPGQTGPAIIAGHRDSRRGAAVFARLDELEAGDRISVRRGDGHVVAFVVRRVASYPKDAFPTAEVYGDTAGPELRLITCDGDFDRGRGSYRENLVVYATADPATLPADPGPAAPRETPVGDPGEAASPGPDAPGSPTPGQPSQSPSAPPASPGPPPGGEPGPQPQPQPQPTPTPRPSGLPTEDGSPSPRPSGGVPLP